MAVIEYMNVVLGANHTKLDQGIDKAVAKVNRMSSDLKTSFAGNFLGNLAATGITRLGDGMLDFGKSSIKAAMDAETAQVAYETMLGSVEAATKMIADLRKLDRESPLNYGDFERAGKTMLAFGVSADEVTQRMAQLSAISLGNSDRFQSLSLAFAQTAAAGRLMGQEVLQFVNAGFNPLQAISKLTGESMADLKRKMEEGKISVELVGMAFDAATGKGGTFADMNERLAQTTAGQLSKLEGIIAAMQRNLGNAMKPITDTVIDQLKRMTDQGEASARRMADLSERLGGPKTAISTPHGSLQRGLNFLDTFATGSGVGAMAKLVNGYDSLTKAANGTKKEVDKANESIEKTQEMKKAEALAALQAGEQREIEAKRLKEEAERTKQLSKQLEIEKQKKFEIEEQARLKALRDRQDSMERARDFLNEGNPFTATIDKLSEAAKLMQGGFLSRQQLNFVAGREARTLAESQTVERRDTPTAMAGSVEAYRLFLERDSDRAKEREIATRANDHLAAIERELASRQLLGVAKR